MEIFDERKPALTVFFCYWTSPTVPWKNRESGWDSYTSETMWVLIMLPLHNSQTQLQNLGFDYSQGSRVSWKEHIHAKSFLIFIILVLENISICIHKATWKFFSNFVKILFAHFARIVKQHKYNAIKKNQSFKTWY